MNHDDHLTAHLQLCQDIYRRMRRDGSWPWREAPDDSTEPGDLVESESDENRV